MREVLKTPRTLELKRQRKLSQKKKIILIFFALVALIAGLSYLSKISPMRIRNIVISGNNVVTRDEIMSTVDQELEGNYFHLFSRQNFLIYPGKAIKKALLADHKRLLSASIDLQDPHTIKIAVSERGGSFLWCGFDFDMEKGENPDQDCYYMDDSGYIFSQAPYFSGNVFFKFFGTGLFANNLDPTGKQYLPPDDFRSLVSFIKSLPRNSITPYGIYLGPDGDYSIFISPLTPSLPLYTKILFNKKNDLQKVNSNLSAALLTEPFATDFKSKFSKLLYIDLRFNNKVFYKFQP